MKKLAFIWKESIYNSAFRCDKCGMQIADPKSGEPFDDTLIDTVNQLIGCPVCKNVVAKYMEIEDNSAEGFMGDWNEYKRTRMN